MQQSSEGLIKQGACSAGSAVDLLGASCFRSSAAVKDARYAGRLRRSKTIDGGKTSEVHAAMRSTARRVWREGAGRLELRKAGAKFRIAKLSNSGRDAVVTADYCASR